MRPPAFWQRDGTLARALAPVSALVANVTARRVSRPGWRAPVPVICCGNVTVGGAGKTTVVIDLARRLRAEGVAVHILLRGYGGSARGPRRVVAGDTAAVVGDEALLLAAEAPTWTGADRAASARLAVADGARVLLMDDGLQNPTLAKDLSLLVIDPAGLGNGRVLPAGPLRETLAAGAARCDAAVVIGDGDVGVPIPVLRARLVPAMRFAPGTRVLAFAGIGRPEKFFATVREAGADVVRALPFPDHHPFSPAALSKLFTEAEALGLVPVTTAKDAARLPPDARARVTVLVVELAWSDPREIASLLSGLAPRP